MATKNMNFAEVDVSDTVGEWLDAMTLNFDKLDAMPLPIAYGSNSQMEYVKLANGTAVMWGRINYGTTYKCTIPWEDTGGAGYASEVFTLNYPIALANATPTVIPHVIDDNRVETFAISVGADYTTYKGRFWSGASDNGGSKTLNILVIGKWK